MDDSLLQYKKKFESGEKPRPAYYREPRASGAPTAAWEAMLASGAYELLDPILFWEITMYYNRVISVNAVFDRYMIRCEEWILTKLQNETSVFYEDNMLLGEFKLLIQMLEEIVDELKQLVIDANKLNLKLQEQFPTE